MRFGDVLRFLILFGYFIELRGKINELKLTMMNSSKTFVNYFTL